MDLPAGSSVKSKNPDESLVPSCKNLLLQMHVKCAFRCKKTPSYTLKTTQLVFRHGDRRPFPRNRSICVNFIYYSLLTSIHAEFYSGGKTYIEIPNASQRVLSLYIAKAVKHSSQITEM